uniref:FLYWCH-type domain-containing protein n=1 Tax=Trichuris muris TaxID=70415 RepID=A0A5S6QMQ2_TRIMR
MSHHFNCFEHAVAPAPAPKVVHDGHMYTPEALDCTRMIKFWRCNKSYEYGCKASIHISVETNEVVKTVNFHCHGGDAAHVNIAAVCTAVKSRAENALETPAAILNHTCQSVLSDVKAQMPSNKTMKKMCCPSTTAKASQSGFNRHP